MENFFLNLFTRMKEKFFCDTIAKMNNPGQGNISHGVTFLLI